MDCISRLIFAGVPVQDAVNTVIRYRMQGDDTGLEKYVLQVENGRDGLDCKIFSENGK